MSALGKGHEPNRQRLPCLQGPGEQRDSGNEPPEQRGPRDAERSLSIGRPSSWRRASGRAAHHGGVEERCGHAAAVSGQKRECKQLEGNICEGDARS